MTDSRRGFLKRLGLGAAAAGATAIPGTKEKLTPEVAERVVEKVIEKEVIKYKEVVKEMPADDSDYARFIKGLSIEEYKKLRPKIVGSINKVWR